VQRVGPSGGLSDKKTKEKKQEPKFLYRKGGGGVGGEKAKGLFVLYRAEVENQWGSKTYFSEK